MKVYANKGGKSEAFGWESFLLVREKREFPKVIIRFQAPDLDLSFLVFFPLQKALDFSINNIVKTLISEISFLFKLKFNEKTLKNLKKCFIWYKSENFDFI